MVGSCPQEPRAYSDQCLLGSRTPGGERACPPIALHPFIFLALPVTTRRSGVDVSAWHTDEIAAGWCLLPLSTTVITTKETPDPRFWSKQAAALCSELGGQCQLPAHSSYYNLRLFKKCRVSSKLLEKLPSSRSLLALLLKVLW